jgi:hypothetical protein
MKSVLNLLKRFVMNPYVELVVGMLFMLAGIGEAWEAWHEEAGTKGLHHGMILIGAVSIFRSTVRASLKSLPHFVQGADFIDIAAPTLEARFPRLLHFMRKMAGSAYLDLSAGLILILFAISDVADTFAQDLANFHFRSAHALLLYGFIPFINAIPDLFEGIQRVSEHRDMLSRPSLWERIGKWGANPRVELTAGVVTVVIALAELQRGEGGEGIQAAHGLLLYAAFGIFKSIGALYEGLERIVEAEEAEVEHKQFGEDERESA